MLKKTASGSFFKLGVWGFFLSVKAVLSLIGVIFAYRGKCVKRANLIFINDKKKCSLGHTASLVF